MVEILDQFGRPVSQGEIRRARINGLIGSGRQSSPYDAADQTSPEMDGWMPWLGAPDAETNPYRDRAVARIRDLVRNDGWASGAVQRLTDSTVGADFRLSSRPDYRALARVYGPKFDAVWAREYAAAREASWRSWAYCPGRWSDATRRSTVPQLIRLAFRHYLVEGEALAVLPWRPDRVGFGRARYATTVQLVDPDRLSNPGNAMMDTLSMRGGVEIDEDGAPIAYHIREAHQGEYFAAAKSLMWERIARETAWGRPMVVHHFDPERAGQHRPIGGIFTAVLGRLRMLAQYDRVELQAAVVNAIFGAYVESPFDPDDVQKGLTEDDISNYQALRSDFHASKRLSVGNVRLATLFPGERINTISSSRPAAAFDAFEGAVLRNFASAIGASFETVSGDYRGSSYSSARQALLTEWKSVTRRRIDFAAGFCGPIADAQLEEAHARGELPLPAGAPDYEQARAEYSRGKWIGPGRGWVDPEAEVAGARMRIASGLSTLELEAAESGGLDLEETLDQLQVEREMVEARGLELQFSDTGESGKAEEEAETDDAG